MENVVISVAKNIIIYSYLLDFPLFQSQTHHNRHKKILYSHIV